MLLVNYESPNGDKNHNKLWNGGHAEGTVKLYRKEKRKFILIDELDGCLGGCEYGEY
jgi:tocopherol cyclase